MAGLDGESSTLLKGEELCHVWMCPCHHMPLDLDLLCRLLLLPISTSSGRRRRLTGVTVSDSWHIERPRSQDLLLQITNHRDVQGSLDTSAAVWPSAETGALGSGRGLTPLHHASALGNYRAVQAPSSQQPERKWFLTE